MTRIHLYGPDIKRMMEAVRMGKEKKPFRNEQENREYQKTMERILNELADRPLPRPYPDRIILNLDEKAFGFLTAGVCVIG